VSRLRRIVPFNWSRRCGDEGVCGRLRPVRRVVRKNGERRGLTTVALAPRRRPARG